MDKMDKARRIFGGSASSALAALLMVGALAFGSTVIRPMTINHEPEATTAQADKDSTGTDGAATAGTAATHVDKPETDFHDYWKPAPNPKQEPTPEPVVEQPAEQPKEETEPAPVASTNLSLTAAFLPEKGKILVEWSAFSGYFEKYKVVRSTDGDVRWPLGSGDTLVGVIGPSDATRFVDYDAPCGIQLFYAAFAVQHSDSGYVVLASSNVASATRTCPAPPPDPVALTFAVAQAAGGVQLSWQQCTSDAFVVYKVVRSATNPDPKYPLNDGTELIGVIGDKQVTGFTDSNVGAGQTWTYRVLCMGQNGGGWYVIGLTPAVSLTVQ